jgi:hypothetical protein
VILESQHRMEDYAGYSSFRGAGRGKMFSIRDSLSQPTEADRPWKRG